LELWDPEVKPKVLNSNTLLNKVNAFILCHDAPTILTPTLFLIPWQYSPHQTQACFLARSKKHRHYFDMSVKKAQKENAAGIILHPSVFHKAGHPKRPKLNYKPNPNYAQVQCENQRNTTL